MNIRMKKDREVSPDGVRVEAWAKGTDHDLTDERGADLCRHLVEIGDAEDAGAKSRKSAPENKAAKPAATKD